MSVDAPKFTPEVAAEQLRQALRRFNTNLMRDHLYLFPDVCQVVYEAAATCHWLTTQVGPAGVERIRKSWLPG